MPAVDRPQPRPGDHQHAGSCGRPSARRATLSSVAVGAVPVMRVLGQRGRAAAPDLRRRHVREVSPMARSGSTLALTLERTHLGCRDMSTHIAAQPGQIAPRVLLPGDPLRASLDRGDVPRGCGVLLRRYGTCSATPAPSGAERVSVQGTGMGQPSLAIYVTELIQEYGAQRVVPGGVVRVGWSMTWRSSRCRTRHQRLQQLINEHTAFLRPALRQPRTSTCSGRRTTPQPSTRTRQVTVTPGVLVRLVLLRPNPELMDALVGYGVVAVEMECQRALHPRGEAPAPGADHLYRLGPHPHWRPDDRP